MSLNNFSVEVLKHPADDDWMLAKTCTLVTVGMKSMKPPTMEWKKKLLAAKHSPIRTLEFCFKLNNIPNFVAVHLCRHVHAIPFVKSQRNDRQSDYDRNTARQDAPVDMCLFLNAEELMTIANKRLCSQASLETRNVVLAICDAVLETNPEFEGLLVPNCEYRGGRCDEFNPCGLYKRYKKQLCLGESNNDNEEQ